jgi:hypothetical protein
MVTLLQPVTAIVKENMLHLIILQMAGEKPGYSMNMLKNWQTN